MTSGAGLGKSQGFIRSSATAPVNSIFFLDLFPFEWTVFIGSSLINTFQEKTGERNFKIIKTGDDNGDTPFQNLAHPSKQITVCRVR
jgi:hypothetical protein